jgi:hypothetical protein
MRVSDWNPHVVEAEYFDQEFPEYRGNPYIETLGPGLARGDVARLMAQSPENHPEYRLLPRERREDWLPLLDQIRQPLTMHLDLYGRIRRLILGGYVTRNPAQPNYYALLERRREAFTATGAVHDDVRAIQPQPTWGQAAARGMTLLGVTGIGKTEGVKMCLRLFPQVVQHTSFRGRRFHNFQVVYIHLQAPKGGSLITTCINFFQEMDKRLGTQYEREMTRGAKKADELIPRMATVAALHGLGLLVIDEIQELRESSGEKAFLSFLGRLTNDIGVPVVMMGGIDALPLMRSQFRFARRGETEGDIILDRSQPGAEWRRFLERIWPFQVTRTETPLGDELADALLEHSQGITDFAIKLYKLAQGRAIALGGDERITKALIESVAQDSLAVAQPVLTALRRGDQVLLRSLADASAAPGVRTVPFARGDAVSPLGEALPANETQSREGVASGASTLPAAAPTAQTPRKRSPPRHPTCPDRQCPGLVGMVVRGRDAGLEPHAALVQAGVIRGEAWYDLVGYDASALKGQR